MLSKIEICEKIATGGFGEVYRGIANDQYQIAIKKIPMNSEGVPCILEASIMSSIHHPSLNFSLKTQIDGGSLLIAQLLAKEDLITYREKNVKVDFATIRNWIFKVSEGLLALHDQRIIHGDIKGSNVLKFGDVVKLSDFSLSRPFGKYTGRICTTTHRPPESWLNLEWDHKADIWALGCTIFEINYGYSLFSDQEDPVAALNSIKMFMNQVFRPVTRLKLENVSFNQPEIPARLIQNRGTIDNLMLSCLQWDPDKRPTIQQLIVNPFFVGLTAQPGTIRSTPTIFLKEEVLIKDKIRILNDHPDFVAMAYQIYNRSLRLKYSERCLIDTSCYLSAKIMKMQISDPETMPHEILLCEQAICSELNFCIHCPVLPSSVSTKQNYSDKSRRSS